MFFKTSQEEVDLRQAAISAFVEPEKKKLDEALGNINEKRRKVLNAITDEERHHLTLELTAAIEMAKLCEARLEVTCNEAILKIGASGQA